MVNASKILPVVLVALILLSAVQAFQLNSLKEKLEGGTVTTGSKSPISSGSTGSAVASSGSGDSGAPASIANLPSMVGGC